MALRKMNLQSLPRFGESWSFLYVEKCLVERDQNAIVLTDTRGRVAVPTAALSCLLLGPGTNLTSSAVELLAANGTSMVWTGEAGVRCYAAGLGETRRAGNLLKQLEAWADPRERLEVCKRMYRVRFDDAALDPNLTLEQLRGKEGVRVRTAYESYSKMFGVKWEGRFYKTQHWASTDPINRAISVANACLHGLVHAALVSTGFSPAIGFVHTGKALSFVYDIADLYKIDITVPAAFQLIGSQRKDEPDRRMRLACRDRFRETRLLERILPDVQRVLGMRADVAKLYDHSEDAPADSRLWDPTTGEVLGGQNHGEPEPKP
jgi:CRISPR-associated protein Cas1